MYINTGLMYLDLFLWYLHHLDSHTFLAKATIANWNPKQIPKYGILVSLAKFAVLIIPSLPRLPNPPGTKIPS